MPGVGVGQQHSVGEMLAQHVGIADWNHIVEDAVNDQARLRDFAELGEALATVLFPSAEGRNPAIAASWPARGSPSCFLSASRVGRVSTCLRHLEA